MTWLYIQYALTWFAGTAVGLSVAVGGYLILGAYTRPWFKNNADRGTASNITDRDGQ